MSISVWESICCWP